MQPSEWIPAMFHTAIGIFIGYPVDTIKTNTQKHKFITYQRCVRHIYQRNGIRGFYKGVLVPLASNALFRPVEFYTYESVRKSYNQWIGGLSAGMVAGLISYPFHVLKINMQLNRPLHEVIKQMTFHKLNLGLRINFLKDIVFCTIFFGTYQTMLDQGSNAGIAGMFASNITWLILCPFDVLRTRILGSNTSNSICQSAIEIYRVFGIKGFWRGITPILLKTTPISGLTMLVYDSSKRWLQQYENT